MGHIPDDDQLNEFMNASAEEWSKSKPAPEQKPASGPTDRWGATIPDPTVSSNTSRWGSEPIEPTRPDYERPQKTGGSKWWIIVLIIVVVMCLCSCLALVGLPALGISLFDWSGIQF